MGTNYEVRTAGYEPLHLGKQSAGWPFLFRAEPDWPEGMLFSEWVERAASGLIFDEYGTEVPFAQLMVKIMESYANVRQRHPDAIWDRDFQFITTEFC